MGAIIFILVVLALIVVVSNIVIVQQASARIVERLGAYQATWNVGMHFKIPFIERVRRPISLKEQVADFLARYHQHKDAHDP